MVKSNSSPIFVIGSPRSGTSIIVRAIKTCMKLEGYSESHLLPLLDQLLKTADSHYATKSRSIDNFDHLHLAHFHQLDLEEALTGRFLSFIEGSFNNKPWFDKTPGPRMIEAVPLVARLFPHGKFIFAKRRGIENIQSRLKKFLDEGFLPHCKDWARCMTVWLQVRQQLEPGRYIEIDQRDIALQPGEIARQLGRFLNLNARQVTGFEEIFRFERPQQSQRTEDYRIVGVDETGWSGEQQQQFRTLCGTVMEAYGYSMRPGVIDTGVARPIVLSCPLEGTFDGVLTIENLNGTLQPWNGGFLVQANKQPAIPVRIRFHDLEFSGHNLFESNVHVRSVGVGPVLFQISVMDRDSGETLIEEAIHIDGEKCQPWSFSFDSLEGRYDVVVSAAIEKRSLFTKPPLVALANPRFSVLASTIG